MIDWGAVITAEKKELEHIKQKRESEKIKKQIAIDKITVNVDGLIFDGNEKSQARMALVANAIGDEALVSWVLHNNKIESVTGKQLREAVMLSALKMSSIWINGNE